MRNINSWQLILCFLGLILIQCRPNENESQADVAPSIKLEEASLFSFDNCAFEVTLIPLVAPKDTLINLSCPVHELLVSDKIYYASKCFNDLSIHSFDLAGTHLKSWNRKGDGPEEYPALHGLIVEQDQLYINTGRGTFLRYGLPAFDFKEH